MCIRTTDAGGEPRGSCSGHVPQREDEVPEQIDGAGEGVDAGDDGEPVAHRSDSSVRDLAERHAAATPYRTADLLRGCHRLPTTLCYLRLSATTAMGLLSVAPRWLGDQGPEWSPSNELSAPVVTIHDVPQLRHEQTAQRAFRLPISPFRRHLMLVKPGVAGRGSDLRADVPDRPGGLAPGSRTSPSALCERSLGAEVVLSQVRLDHAVEHRDQRRALRVQRLGHLCHAAPPRMSANASKSGLPGSHGMEVTAANSQAPGGIACRARAIGRRRWRIAAIWAAERRAPPRFASLRSGSRTMPAATGR